MKYQSTRLGGLREPYDSRKSPPVPVVIDQKTSRRAVLIKAHTGFRLAEYTKVPVQPGGKG